ncbi:hypothetical protein FE257_005707 [Aspergillus nanangensis]|uniref:Uncharacterized protein n=1 Tax=Aspergillus nanangensis TaxID=2582783 RepID=A0AAD4GVA4_ASPNN|nr:hypothetical protein FE257_005707 [Aspergillus nanangensis]
MSEDIVRQEFNHTVEVLAKQFYKLRIELLASFLRQSNGCLQQAWLIAAKWVACLKRQHTVMVLDASHGQTEGNTLAANQEFKEQREFLKGVFLYVDGDDLQSILKEKDENLEQAIEVVEGEYGMGGQREQVSQEVGDQVSQSNMFSSIAISTKMSCSVLGVAVMAIVPGNAPIEAKVIAAMELLRVAGRKRGPPGNINLPPAQRRAVPQASAATPLAPAVAGLAPAVAGLAPASGPQAPAAGPEDEVPPRGGRRPGHRGGNRGHNSENAKKKGCEKVGGICEAC